MEIDKKTERDIQKFEGEVYKRIGISSIRSRQKNEDGSRKVLSIECEDGKWWLVAFFSKSLNKIERNYEIHNKKMLTVIRGLKNWRHLLEGTKYKFEIWINHKNLEYFMRAQKLNRRQAQ